MSGQSSLFDLMTSTDSCSVISSPESASGPTHCEVPDGRMMKPSGLEAAPVSPSVTRARVERLKTRGIFGPPGSRSSKHDALSWSLASRLRPLTDLVGSTLFTRTWTVRTTPLGVSIYALRASGRRIEGSGFTSWPTPQERDHFWAHTDEYLAGQKAKGHGCSNLNDYAAMACWHTPAVDDAKGTDYNRYTESGIEPGRTCALQDQAQLASWPTPRANDNVQTNLDQIAAKGSSWLGQGRGATVATMAPTNGFWREAGWIYCRDNKWRAVEPGTFPLVDGTPERVLRLRGYGDAIVAPVAAEFIRAFRGVR